jgi:hypothetical protein
VSEVDHEDGLAETGRRRKKLYWILSAVSSGVFLLFTFVLMMVPREHRTEELVMPLWMLSIAGVALAVTLAIGVWKPLTSEAPVASGLPGQIVTILLALELFACTLGAVGMVREMLR